MKIVVVYGFLGCGKTTLINYMLKHVLIDESVVIIENESGKESVDGDFLRSQNYSVVDLRAGCVCCTLRSELPGVIKKVESDLSPDVLVIEPSGIASLEDILSISTFSVDNIITLVDVERFDMLMQLNRNFYMHQFRLSPIIFLSKTDLVEHAIVDRIQDELELASPMAYIIRDYSNIKASDWHYNLKCQYKYFNSFVMQKNFKPIKFVNGTFAISKVLSKDRVDSLFVEMKMRNLTPIRCKGIVKVDSQLVKLDFTGASITYALIDRGNIKEGYLTFWWKEDFLDINYKEAVVQLIHEFLYV